jgi:lysophospholipase L1-like esterase
VLDWHSVKVLLEKLLLSLVSVAVLLLVLECVARLALDPVSRVNWTPMPSTIVVESSIPGVPYQLRPNAVATQEFGSDPRGYFDEGATLTYRANSLGFRGPDVPLEKEPGVVRIVGLGDSFTFGTGVRYEDTFLHVLETILNEADLGARFEVLNLGTSGYNTWYEVALLSQLDPAMDFDVVLICFFLNDAGAGGTTRPFNVATAHADLPFWRRHSRLLDQLAARIERRQAAKRLGASYRDSFREDAAGWVRARKALVRARVLANQRGFRLVLAIFPVLWNLSDDYPFAEIHETVASFAKSWGIPVLDLLPAFDGCDGPELWVHPNNQHPNELAHEIAGRALARFLVDRDILAPSGT